MARYIAREQQKFTQRGGVRPYGITNMLAGQSNDGTAQLWATDPSGSYSQWKANATGRNEKNMKEFLEKNYPEEPMSKEDAIKLTIKTLMEVVESGSKNIDVAIVVAGQPMVMLEDSVVDSVSAEIEKEKEAAKARRDISGEETR
jgi:20S proteasome subunit alpha 4